MAAPTLRPHPAHLQDAACGARPRSADRCAYARSVS